MPSELIGYAAALGVGLLIGVERERAKGSGPNRAAAGVRTFLLIALSGAIADRIGTMAIAVAGGFLALLVLVSYRRSREADPGLTTEVTMLATFLLGLLAMRDAAMAGGLGIIVVLALASKSRLHRFTRQVLSEQELHDAIVLIAAALVILPVLPDQPLDPWAAINPRKLWILVVAVMSVSSAAYIALRADLFWQTPEQAVQSVPEEPVFHWRLPYQFGFTMRSPQEANCGCVGCL